MHPFKLKFIFLKSLCGMQQVDLTDKLQIYGMLILRVMKYHNACYFYGAS